jgi:hypothetical protein
MQLENTTISLAKICQYLYTVDILGSNSFFNGSVDKRRNIQLYMERVALEYGNTQNIPNNQGVSNYVYTLLGTNLQRSTQILTGGSGGIVPPASQGGNSLTPYPINVIISVGQSNSMILTNSAWIGLQDINQIVINQSVFQSGSQFVFSPLTGTFDFSLSLYTLQVGDFLTGLGFLRV